MLLVAPSAFAAHWTVYAATAPGLTREDDGLVLHASGNPLDGTANRVVYQGRVPGDGSDFLDVRVGSQVGAGSDGGTDLYLHDFDSTGAPPVLLAGAKRASAWYGEWSDLDGDRAIDDVHDACATGCGPDEFKWRGAATPVAVAVALFLTPSAGSGALTDTVPGAIGYGNASRVDRAMMVDRTALSNAEQSWEGFAGVNPDGGFLTPLHTIVIAGAGATSGSLGFDFSDPAGLVDVDRYEAVNGDVAGLYAGAVSAHRAGAEQVRAIQRAIAEATTPVVDLVAELRGELPPTPSASDLVDANARARFTESVAAEFLAADAKEPNTPWDDSEERALFGLVGDRLGAFNAYPGHKSTFGLFFDVVPRSTACVGAYAEAAGTGTTLAQAPTCSSTVSPQLEPYYTFLFSLDPFARAHADQRTGFATLTFIAYPYLWRDTNGDTHLGHTCARDSAEFDSERNHCKSAPYPWPHGQTGPGNSRFTDELVPVCEVSTAKSGSFTLAPVDGEWPPAVLVRHVHQTTRVAFDQDWEVLTGSDPVTLRWQNSCTSFAVGRTPQLLAEDAIVFLAPSQVALRLEARATIEGFTDLNKGIAIGRQSSLDVDVIAPAL